MEPWFNVLPCVASKKTKRSFLISKGWPAIAKLKPLSLFSSLFQHCEMLSSALVIKKWKVKVVLALQWLACPFPISQLGFYLKEKEKGFVREWLKSWRKLESDDASRSLSSLLENINCWNSIFDNFSRGQIWFCHEKLFKFKAILFLIGEIMNSIIRSPHTEWLSCF